MLVVIFKNKDDLKCFSDNKLNMKPVENLKQKNSDKERERVAKWKAMKQRGLFIDKNKLSQRVYRGIPSQMRKEIWPALVKLNEHIQQRKGQLNYSELIKKPLKQKKDPDFQILNSIPESTDRDKLLGAVKNIYRGISAAYPMLHISQPGLISLIFRILQVLSEDTTFWLVHYLLETDKRLRNTLFDTQSLYLHHYILERVLDDFSPHLSKNLKTKELNLIPFTISCLGHLFSINFSRQLFNRAFQVFLVEGWTSAYALAASILQKQQKQIKGSNQKETQAIIKTSIYETPQIDPVFRSASTFELPMKKIGQYEAEFNKRKRQAQLTQSKLKRQSYERKNHKYSVQQQKIDNVNFCSNEEQSDFQVFVLLKFVKQ